MIRATFWVFLLNGLLVAGILTLFRVLDPPQLGEALAAATFLYLILIPIVASLRSHPVLLDAWLFLLPLSVFQIAPDGFLAHQFHVLGFAQYGGYHVGAVPVYMPGLWMAALLTLVWLGEVIHARSSALATAAVAVASLALFGAAEWEAHRLSLWYAHGVRTYQGVALYVLPAEVLLGLGTWLAFVQVQGRTIVHKLAGAAAVSVFYTGALVVSHMVFSRVA